MFFLVCIKIRINLLKEFAINFFLVTWVNLTLPLQYLWIHHYLSQKMVECLWCRLCRTNVNFHLFAVACRFVYYFVTISMHPCVTFIALNTIMIFHYRFATDFTGEINNYIFKGERKGHILLDRLIICKVKSVLSVFFIFHVSVYLCGGAFVTLWQKKNR